MTNPIAHARFHTAKLAALLMMGIALTFGSQAVADQGYALVKKIQGTATYTSALGQGPLKEGQVLIAGAQITTAANSYVDLNLGVNGDALRVEENSSLTLTELTFRKYRSGTVVKTEMNVTQGHVVANVVRKLSRNSRYNIRTPNGVAGIRGTCVRAGSTMVLALIGQVQFTTVNGQTSLIIGGFVMSAGANQPFRAAMVETQGVATTATQSTANTGTAAMVQQTVQQFAAAIAAQAAVGGATTPGATPAQTAQTAAQTAAAVVEALVQAVEQAAAEAPPEIRAEVQRAVQTVQQQAAAVTVQAAASAAATATVAATTQAGSTPQQVAQAQQAAAQAAAQAGQLAIQSAARTAARSAQNSGSTQQQVAQAQQAAAQTAAQQVQQTQATIPQTTSSTIQAVTQTIQSGGNVDAAVNSGAEASTAPSGSSGDGGTSTPTATTQSTTVVDTSTDSQDPVVTGVQGRGRTTTTQD
jgi:hypothetical protein